MRPLVIYFGGKWSLAKRYGPPQHEHVIEPFAGFAGYSSYWEPKRVSLIEKDPVVVAVWRFLQRAKASEIMRLPTEIDHVDEMQGACQEAKWLAGFWLDRALAKPASRRRSRNGHEWSAHAFWGAKVRARIAANLPKVREWSIIEGDYSQAPDIEAHWHIDPPYSSGKNYRCNELDYAQLGEWCRKRRGFVQVCESEGATWLPFETFAILTTPRPRGFSAEALWEQSNPTRAETRDPVSSLVPVSDRTPPRHQPLATNI